MSVKNIACLKGEFNIGIASDERSQSLWRDKSDRERDRDRQTDRQRLRQTDVQSGGEKR